MSVQRQRSKLVSWLTISTTVGLSADYDVDVLQDNWEKILVTDNKNDRNIANSLETVKTHHQPWVDELPNTRVENYKSRMDWIDVVADRYHKMMLRDDDRAYLKEQLTIIADWDNSKY